MCYSFGSLTRRIAEERSTEIVGLHNLIPFQYWSAPNLLADRDERRQFGFKWDLSQAAYFEDKLVGICIAFYDVDTRPGAGFLYLHRIAVSPEQRRRGVGRELVRRACGKFVRLLPERDAEVIVQTAEEDSSALTFYLKLGFRAVGRKPYGDRVDVVLLAKCEDLLAIRS